MDITITCSASLSDEETQQIKELEKICFENENLENHLFLSNEINFKRSIPTFFLAYKGKDLIGFLTFFIPTIQEAEISAIVHPSYRRRGVFSKLDKKAREVIKDNDIKSVIYSVETKSKSAECVLKHLGLSEIIRSEYRMTIDSEALNKYNDLITSEPNFDVKKVTQDNVACYLNISNKAFNGEDEGDYADNITKSETRINYLFCKDNIPVGTFSIGLEMKDEPFIYGVAVAEDMRGNGYGRKMMKSACRIGLQYGKDLHLDVDSENPVAFSLYKSMGFEITFQVDYYKG